MVFTWGDGRRGQLGHGELETWRSRPHCVEALKVVLIIQHYEFPTLYFIIIRTPIFS